MSKNQLIIIVDEKRNVEKVSGYVTFIPKTIQGLERWRGKWDESSYPAIVILSLEMYFHPFADQLLRRASVILSAAKKPRPNKIMKMLNECISIRNRLASLGIQIPTAE